MNQERNFTKILKEICNEENIKLISFSDDWIFRFEKDGKVNHILGYQFGLNLGVSNKIATDKAGTSDILTYAGVPNVKHHYFMPPSGQKWISHDGNWIKITELLKKYGKVVCKDNQGTRGSMVFKVENQLELEKAVFDIFAKNDQLAVSPFIEIENEYRLVMLGDVARLVFCKKRNPESEQWKHNLGLGATAEVVTDEKILKKLVPIAKKAMRALNLRFASVDIVSSDKDVLQVLEVNSGVMMEHFSQESPENYQLAKTIYRDAIVEMVS